MNPPKKYEDIFGILTSFHQPEDLLKALKGTLQAGYTRIDTLTPYGLEEVPELLKIRETRWMPRLALTSGIFVALISFGWQTWNSAFSYPLDIGGRPVFSWPAYVMPVLDFGIFCSVASMFFGMILILKLPKYNHPILQSASFSTAKDRFYLLILATDQDFHPLDTQEFLKKFNPLSIELVKN